MKGHKCPTCTKLARALGARLNDVNDVKIKLVRVRDGDAERIDRLRKHAEDCRSRWPTVSGSGSGAGYLSGSAASS